MDLVSVGPSVMRVFLPPYKRNHVVFNSAFEECSS